MSEPAICFYNRFCARGASFAPTATFAALDLPFPILITVVKFWGVLWCLRVSGPMEPLIVFKTAACLLVIEHIEEGKENGHSFVFDVPRLSLLFVPKGVFLGMSLWHKLPRQSEA